MFRFTWPAGIAIWVLMVANGFAQSPAPSAAAAEPTEVGELIDIAEHRLERLHASHRKTRHGSVFAPR